MGGRTVPILSIGWSFQALALTYFVSTVFFLPHQQQAPNLYLVGAGRWWLRVDWVERIGIWLLNYTVTSNIYRKPEIGKGSKTYFQLQYTGRVSPFQSRWMGFPVGTFPTQVGLFGGWWSTGLAKSKHHLCHLLIKNSFLNIRIRLGEWCSWLPQIHRQRIFEGCLPFLPENVIATRSIQQNVKKTQNGNLLDEIDSRKQAENILKMKIFQTTKCKAYPDEKLSYRSYQKLGVGSGYHREDDSSTGKAGSDKYQKNYH